MRTPSVTVFVDPKTSDWLIQRHVIDKKTRFTVVVGVPSRIAAADVPELAINAIGTALNSFGEVANPPPSSIDMLPQKDRTRFYSSHWMVSIGQPKPDCIELSLMAPKDGGFVGTSTRTVNRNSADFDQMLVNAVLDLTSGGE